MDVRITGRNGVHMKKQIIGITGGVGCGKSVVMDILEKEYGAYVLLADSVGHELMKPGEANYNGIVEYFGTDILDENGEIDRRRLGARVFGYNTQLKALNDITHPNIINEIRNRLQSAMDNPEVPLVCLESAILLDTELHTFCDTIWYVFANEEVRIERLMAGRGYTEEYCKMVMYKQKGEDFYKNKSNVIIDNSGSVEETIRQLAELLKS